jgi:hypothetical protein
MKFHQSNRAMFDLLDKINRPSSVQVSNEINWVIRVVYQGEFVPQRLAHKHSWFS